MSDVIISVENLGKKYILSHQGNGAGGYNRFSERLEHWAKTPMRWLQQSMESRRVGAFHGKSKGEGEDLGIHEKLNKGVGELGIHGKLDSAAREEFWALKGVSFEVKRGEVVGIIGRNGAGKSTLLKILSRITEPTEGRVTLRGRVASLLEVGTGFHPELTGRENIFLNGAILGMTKAEIKKKFDEIVAFAEVERFLDTPVKRYSSGMYVRLAFAVAAHLEPEILVVDEVLAVGDAEFQKKCLGKMKDVATGGRTVLFVSHNMGAVQSLCFRGILLENGHIKEQGEVSRVVEVYGKSGLSQKKIKRENKLNKKTFIAEAEAHFKKETEEIEIHLGIESKSSSKISVECRLLDTYQTPLAFLSRGRLDMAQKINLEAGTKKIMLKGKLPRLLKGRYFLWISLADPLVTYLDICQELLEVEIEFSSVDGSKLDLSPMMGFGHVEVPLQINSQTRT